MSATSVEIQGKPNRMKKLFSILQIFVTTFIYSQNVSHPFPQHAKYYPGVITPDHISQNEMDHSVISFYHQWKSRYIKKSNCSDGLYIWSENAGYHHECVSEGQGYGMIIVALMAGIDSSAHTTFDGLYNYYREHPSKRNKFLMSWAQSKACKNSNTSSASDGDIDIAFSLLLANTQWPGNGKIQYAREAENLISAISEQEINNKKFTILQSNSIESDSKDYFDMRTSDFIPSEFRVFYNASKNIIWLKLIDSCYRLFDYLQTKYSPGIGLVPDFVQGNNNRVRPAKRNYLESRYDGIYNFNACRAPWRIATDYIINGDPRSKKFVDPINAWIQETTSSNPDNISAGYTLSGDDLKSRNFEALCFISSFAISAMVDIKNQEWLNKLWDYIIKFKLKDFDYYDNTLKMLNLIILSHNYWIPDE
jgi:endo-1,4-beta-D-glucanase Y